MPAETYYRGESSLHRPAKPGQYSMDFGDGLYLTSEKKTAEIYAQKRVVKTGGVPLITQVSIQPGELGRVLDLTTDARWAKFYTTPMVPGKPDTAPKALMQIQQNNHAIFQQFLKLNRIDIGLYDAVKGPEITHGGTQIVILDRNGARSSIAQRIQARLTPVNAIAAAGAARSGGRVGLTVRAIGGTLFTLGLGILAAILRARVDRSWIEKGLREIEPEAWKTLHKRVPLIADVAAQGKKAYANIYIQIVWRKEAAAGVDFVDSMPLVKLISVDATAENLNAEGVTKSESGFGYSRRIVPLVFSFEVSVPDETVKVWKEMKEEWEWYEKQMSKAPSDALRGQQESFHQEIVQVFGAEADLVLKAWMWPKFRFKAKTA